MKGCPSQLAIAKEAFEKCLYDKTYQHFERFGKLQYKKNKGTICLINMTKRSLNACYTKFFVESNNVVCRAHNENLSILGKGCSGRTSHESERKDREKRQLHVAERNSNSC